MGHGPPRGRPFSVLCAAVGQDVWALRPSVGLLRARLSKRLQGGRGWQEDGVGTWYQGRPLVTGAPVALGDRTVR